MSTHSDFCCYFTFPKIKTEKFKNLFKEYIIQKLDDNDSPNRVYLLNEFYEIVNGIPLERIGFCLYMESIKFTLLELTVTELIKFFKKIKKSVNLEYEARELCTEYLSFDGDYHELSNKNGISTLYIQCLIDGIPETNNIKLLDWIKT